MGFDCPQNTARPFAYPNTTAQYAGIVSSFSNQLNHTQSEDCLKLNIWSKSSPSSGGGMKGSLKPVMVWIHGGRFSTGTSHTPFYEGSILAEAEDVVVVTFNFRMNIFGFPGSPETTQNLGFLDQHMAVTWVSENIASFGGDPERITVLGQSSGAVSIGNWAFAFRDQPVAAGLVSHSGNEFSFPLNSLELAAKNWHNVTGTLGCSASTEGGTLACMQSPNVTFQSLLDAMKFVSLPPQSTPTRSQSPFQATIDNATVFSPQEYASRLNAGSFAHIPYFQIINDYEAGYYKIAALAQGNALPEGDWTRFQLESFTCATAADARARSSFNSKLPAGGVQVPMYRARYMADWENLRLYDPPSSGAYHGVDINMVMGNSEAVSGIAPGAEEAELTRVMQRAWAAFATDPHEGLSAIMRWPRYNAEEDSLILLGVNTTSRVEFVSPNRFDEPCAGLGLSYETDHSCNQSP
ncbi:hypothetical protein SLS62_011227 [Diatrype stigma]|uniref:Carboxylic ester hydrolase n=1 Tax=Diatrype stigma TaxID=117547 RepID=A0AAN9U573_9PEZI